MGEDRVQGRLVDRLKSTARLVKRDIVALWLAARDSRTPWYAKLVAALVAAYALSPIDLIPDFIPIFGYLDDLIIVPLGLWLAIRLIPNELMAEFRRDADARASAPTSWFGASIVALVWVLFAMLLVRWVWPATIERPS
jgi:uncharacterized membrane protein YkvA (DUF1232 family)